MIASWPCPASDGQPGAELAICFDRKRAKRLLVLPALFDEANKLRRQTLEVMRRLDLSGIDCFLPDLPGCNESPQLLEKQTLAIWRYAAAATATHFKTTHVLAIRAGAIVAPQSLPGWRYAPIGGAAALRALLRSRMVASKEAGRDEKMADLARIGLAQGLELAGYRIGPGLFAELESAQLPDSGKLTDIDQSAMGGGGLWLRAEPDENSDQADALAAIVAMGLLA